MNLHGIASGQIAAVNPLIPVTVQISAGPPTTNADGSQTPGYASPGAITASIAGTTLTVTAQASGILQPGQALSDLTADLLAGTTIVQQITGTPGGIGTYQVNRSQTVGSEAMTTSYPLNAQIQPITWRDLQQLDGLNLGGVRWKAYLFGEVDAVVRPEKKGGDLLIIPPPNRHAGVWLCVQILEQWPDWCVAAIVLQNGA